MHAVILRLNGYMIELVCHIGSDLFLEAEVSPRGSWSAASASPQRFDASVLHASSRSS